MTAFYNEIDPYAAQWIRNLITAGLIAPGVVDERSIEDIKPEELYGYTQCHFFAGVGVWSLALRAAGWPDSRSVWTGSCPCQPFSAAGAGAGFADERHLWPAFHHLIAECRPPEVLGEQVASSHVDPWIDLVHADLEALGYTFGGIPFPSAGVGAPHIRDRLYWAGSMANTDNARLEGRKLPGKRAAQRATGAGGVALRLAYTDDGGRIGGRPGQAGNGGDTPRIELERFCDAGGDLPGAVNGLWRDADWLACTDGKWRPVEPGTFPLVNGAAGRVGRGGADWRTPAGEEGKGHRAGRLKGYGNAINAEAARIFVQCVMGAV